MVLAFYMLSLILIVAGLYIKAFSMWLRLQDSSAKLENEKEVDEKVDEQETKVYWTLRFFNYFFIKF